MEFCTPTFPGDKFIPELESARRFDFYTDPDAPDIIPATAIEAVYTACRHIEVLDASQALNLQTLYLDDSSIKLVLLSEQQLSSTDLGYYGGDGVEFMNVKDYQRPVKEVPKEMPVQTETARKRVTSKVGKLLFAALDKL